MPLRCRLSTIHPAGNNANGIHAIGVAVPLRGPPPVEYLNRALGSRLLVTLTSTPIGSTLQSSGHDADVRHSGQQVQQLCIYGLPTAIDSKRNYKSIAGLLIEAMELEIAT